MKIFIADDSKLFRERLINMLSDIATIEIIGQAENGIEAISSIRKLKPDLVILDIQMPRRSGIGVLLNIKKYKIAPKVIMVTNYQYPQYREKCMELGADFFFNKSEEFEKVIDVVRKLTRDFNSLHRNHDLGSAIN